MQVFSRVAERLKAKEIRKGVENFKTSHNCYLVPSLPPKMKILLILAKKCWRKEIKTFPSFPISHEN